MTKLEIGVNDLASKCPDLVPEWSDKNAPLTPQMFFAHSNRKVWWVCSKGHEWQARIADRTDGHGCPYCAGQRLLRGFNDLATTHPDLASEWSERNGSLRPEDVTSFSRENVFWKCTTCGHEWQAVVHTRVKGSPCSVCSCRKIFSGVNDLGTTHPELAAEWNYARNGSYRPEHMSCYSTRKVWWKSEACGHEWRARISDRVLHGQGCPCCEDDRRSIYPQLLCAHYAKKVGVRVKLDDEELIGLPLDIYLPEQKSVILISNQKKYYKRDREWENLRAYLCESRGLRVIRILPEGGEELWATRIVRFCQEGDREREKQVMREAVAEAMRVAGVYVKGHVPGDSTCP